MFIFNKLMMHTKETYYDILSVCLSIRPMKKQNMIIDDKPYILYVLKALVLLVYQINCLQRFPLISSVLLHIVSSFINAEKLHFQNGERKDSRTDSHYYENSALNKLT
jgi:hypothetical protein